MTAKLILFALFVVSMLLMSFSLKRKKRKVIFLGDFMTEVATRSGGFIGILQDILFRAGMEEEFELVCRGLAGNHQYDRYLKTVEDILANGADIVFIFTGLNDLARTDSPFTGTSVERSEAFYIELVQKLIAAGIQVIVCTPSLIRDVPPSVNEEDLEIEHLSQVIRKIAAIYTLQLVDTGKEFTNNNMAINVEDEPAGGLVPDETQLSFQKNQVAAREIWRVLHQLISL